MNVLRSKNLIRDMFLIVVPAYIFQTILIYFFQFYDQIFYQDQPLLGFFLSFSPIDPHLILAVFIFITPFYCIVFLVLRFKEESKSDLKS